GHTAALLGTRGPKRIFLQRSANAINVPSNRGVITLSGCKVRRGTKLREPGRREQLARELCSLCQQPAIPGTLPRSKDGSTGSVHFKGSRYTDRISRKACAASQRVIEDAWFREDRPPPDDGQ